MIDLDEKLKEFESKQKRIQNSLLDAKNFPKDECISFGGITLHPKMQFGLFEDEKIQLAHTVVHTVFSTQKSNKGIAKRIHKRLLSEFKKRDLDHNEFDDLDNI